ncbi:UDP-2-acetamido-2,6-beta-L-arabino-hexul-4-ose reductase [Oxalicibacterium faecigallinarum]|uniref:UDP-2-acetamido-2,6-beta-L-arabino-hexul-4-ose reductase n=1 Tax=Oxalicibacterium faecigallinarum TaxID=573741 RepID=UPI001663E6AF|nr:NAD-dependent epimerase/dehydratase family protein [Oxalicibacterium faecigallinarum]
MKVLITGANGFIGKNLQVHLAERKDVQVVCLNRQDDLAQLPSLLIDVDWVFHLAGVNRPQDPADFTTGNQQLTQRLCEAIVASARPIPIVYTSSIQATLDNAYGASKLAAEQALLSLAEETGSPVYLYRLPNVFGKWSRPNYNSAVATFCNNIAKSLPIQINDANAVIHLVYIDDVIADFIAVLDAVSAGVHRREITPMYSITVGALADQIKAFKDSRATMVTEAVGQGLTRALYSTYLSFLSPEQFFYEIPVHVDPRGRFVEMLKTKDSGQFSFFTAHPKVTRGGHYHHSKNEKFLVIQGKARFAFRHVVTGETYELMTSGASPTIVETVPGWSHDITNIGEEEMIVMLWANEIFDRQSPDTISHKV